MFTFWYVKILENLSKDRKRNVQKGGEWVNEIEGGVRKNKKKQKGEYRYKSYKDSKNVVFVSEFIIMAIVYKNFNNHSCIFLFSCFFICL